MAFAHAALGIEPDALGFGDKRNFRTPHAIGSHPRGFRRILDDVPWAAIGSENSVVAARRAADENDGSGLGQLASVLDAIARQDTGDETGRLVGKLLGERRELELQLERRQDFERQRREESRLLDESLVERRRTQTEAVGCKRHIAHLEMELEFVEQEIKHWEDDLVGMHEADDAAGDRRYSEGERRYILEKMEQDRLTLQKENERIEEMRLRLEGTVLQKIRAHEMQRELLEQQRHTEQDRGTLLTALESERGKLSSMRSERLRLQKERAELDHELADTAAKLWVTEHTKPPRQQARSVPDAPSYRKGIPADSNPSVVYHHEQRRGPNPMR